MFLGHLGALVLTLALCRFAVQANDNIAIDCCMKTSTHPINLNILERYEDQNPEGGCQLPAVLFITKKGKRLCAPPNLTWVMKRKKQLANKIILGKKKTEGRQQKKNTGKKANGNRKSKKIDGKKSL